MQSVFSARTASATVSAGIVFVVGALCIGGRELGPLALHMGAHILTMNVAAPMLAAALVTLSRASWVNPAWLWSAAFIQLATLWTSHLPSLHDAAADSHFVQIGMHCALLLASLLFWTAVLAFSDVRRWHAVAALLLSGKIVCFLAALLVFAPRSLYSGHAHGPDAFALADQQLAGLLMIAACPLSYLLAAIIITVQLVQEKSEIHPTRAVS